MTMDLTVRDRFHDYMPGLDDTTRAGLLLRLARQITGRHNLDDVLAEVLRCLRPLVDFGGGSIQLLDDEGWIQMAASDPIAPPHVMSQRIPLGASVAGRVILTEHPVYLPDIAVETDATTDSKSERRVSTGVRSYFAVPLVADGRAIGVLQVDSSKHDAWTDGERAVFLAAAPIVASAIQNARAHTHVATAQSRTESIEKRLTDAQTLVAAARLSLRNGDRQALERQLLRIEALLGGNPTDGNLVQLPRPRSSDVMHVVR